MALVTILGGLAAAWGGGLLSMMTYSFAGEGAGSGLVEGLVYTGSFAAAGVAMFLGGVGMMSTRPALKRPTAIALVLALALGMPLVVRMGMEAFPDADVRNTTFWFLGMAPACGAIVILLDLFVLFRRTEEAVGRVALDAVRA